MRIKPDKGVDKFTSGANPARSPEDAGGAGSRGSQETGAYQSIGELLVGAGAITRAQYDQAVSVQAGGGGEIVDILISQGHIGPSDLVNVILSDPGVVAAGSARFEISPAVLGLVSPVLARKHRIVPMDRVGEVLLVGTSHLLDAAAKKELEGTVGLELKMVLCSSADIEAALGRYYSEEVGQGPADMERQVQELEGTLRLSHVAHLIRQLRSLPALPETVGGVHQAIEDPSSSIANVVEIITMDPPVAAKVLSVANSAAYGFRHDIHDLKLAVSLLGLRETYAIVLSVAVVDFLNKVKRLDYRSFWIESMCCATATRIVAKACGHRQLVGVFSAGLLHDLGRAALWATVPDLYEKVGGDLWALDLVAEEERIVGLSHTEAGYELAHRWNLPAEIAEPIRFHHRPERATTAKTQVAVVAVAELMVRARGRTVEENKDVFLGYENILDMLDLDSETAEAVLEEYLVLRDHALREAMG
ncbi:MAG TPA: HDOD domain-containing protein [Candidatus Hydrogenedentes bacterium]|nr:HDOD domain-containing protein [Candidatus Hydrogenedentota bacterium]